MAAGQPSPFIIFACASIILVSASLLAFAEVVEYSFHVQNHVVDRLCEKHEITVVNQSLPGPTILVREGDTLVVHVFNESPYNLTIHWHGILQLLSGWADGAVYVTQCPISPGHSYTYRFNVTDQEGTLWWHAHTSMLRATVYGALIIRPRRGLSYPFPKPDKEFPIILGEWWNANIVDVDNEGALSPIGPNVSDAYTINGQPGDLYPCSSKHTHKIKVTHGKTYLLRLISASVNNVHFFKISHHKMTVVAVDASYTNPYVTDVVAIAPGQTTDILLTADQRPGLYYMAARPYISATLFNISDNSTTTGIIEYSGAPENSSKPQMPNLPETNDKQTIFKFSSNLTGLVDGRFGSSVPKNVDEHMFITVGLGLFPCEKCEEPLFPGMRLVGSMNNESFQIPQTKLSMLEAFHENVDGIYTPDFPNQPPKKFDYTDEKNYFNYELVVSQRSTKVKKVKFNSTVEIVLQNTALVRPEYHPLHLHGYNFHILAQGFGNYDPERDREKFNLINPQVRNTVGVPAGGWVVVRFQAQNPGVWLMHCHLETHLPWGLATAFVIENGPTPSTIVPPPPSDLPKC